MNRCPRRREVSPSGGRHLFESHPVALGRVSTAKTASGRTARDGRLDATEDRAAKRQVEEAETSAPLPSHPLLLDLRLHLAARPPRLNLPESIGAPPDNSKS